LENIDILVENLKKKGFSYTEIYSMMNSEESIPVSKLNNRNLGMLESIVKYLKEEKKKTFVEIARLLNRDQRTIWSSYNNVKRKIKNAG
jgi:hypothetical protein